METIGRNIIEITIIKYVQEVNVKTLLEVLYLLKLDLAWLVSFKEQRFTVFLLHYFYL